jgi:hypothetical protein
MFDAIKPLLESGIIDKEIGQQLNEAWNSKLNEAREQVRAELREEFGKKYEHDKNIMVEALDKMVTSGLHAEVAEFREERKAMNEDRVRAQAKLSESAKKFNDFMVTKLAEEIRELRSDRKVQMEGREKLEKFVVNALSREIREFEQDKRAVVEAKVKLVAEAKSQLEQLKKRFVAESAKRIKDNVTTHLQGEIRQLKEDIQAARESQFGRRLFEAFAAEFRTTHLNESAEIRKLQRTIAKKNNQLAESVNQIKSAKRLVESKEREVRIIRDSNLREKTLAELLGTLNEEKSSVMRNLLESVQTPKLKAAFDKYLPAVLNNGKTATESVSSKKIVTEAREVVTGNKTATKVAEAEDHDNLIDFKRLAGL